MEFRNRLEQLVITQLRDEHGDAAVVREPLISRFTGYNFGDQDVPADYLQAIEAAGKLSNAARGLMVGYADKARGQGRSWAEIADAFHIDSEQVSDPAVEAFERIAPPDESGWCRDNYTTWTCTSCQQRVTDRGPWNPHPADNESGHADGCERHDREIREYVSGRDDLDYGDFDYGDDGVDYVEDQDEWSERGQSQPGRKQDVDLAGERAAGSSALADYQPGQALVDRDETDRGDR